MVFNKVFLEKEKNRVVVSFMNGMNGWQEIFTVDYTEFEDGDDIMRGIRETFINMFGSEVLVDFGEESE